MQQNTSLHKVTTKLFYVSVVSAHTKRATRNTLDISAVPILKKETHLPVVVDVTHSTGRRDLLLPTAKAALAIGADAVMAEVHPDPAVALSDSAQQMDIPEFHKFMEELKGFKNKLS